MRIGSMAAAACAVALFVAVAGVPGARAGECVVNASSVPPSDLTNALSYGGALPGQLAGVPFSAVSLQSMTLNWPGCSADCVFVQYEGEGQCGDLVGTPVEYFRLVTHPLIQPSLISNVVAGQAANGKWTLSAQAFLSDTFEQLGGAAGYSFELGTREVIDLTSNGGPDTLPLDIGIRAGTHIGIAACEDGLYRWNAMRDLRFRVTEQPTSGPERPLVDTIFYDQFVVVDDVYPVEVMPDSTLTVEVYLQVTANATGAQDVFGNVCAGGTAFFDMDPAIAFYGQGGGSAAYDGIQLLFSPDPALGFAPRSGIVYETVPETDALGGAGAALATLASRARRRLT